MRIRKMLSILLVVVLFVAMIPVASAADDTEEPYVIWVDGTKFTSDQEVINDSWYYDPETQALTLNDYDGAEIVAGGDLTIWVYGETIIQGNSWHGISSDGSATIYCVNCSLTVYGGNATANRSGYAAIRAKNDISCYSLGDDTAITLVGGTCDQAGYYGGDALSAARITLMGDGQITATGGAATAPSEYGGYAVYTDKFYLGTNSALKGGSGSLVTEAVYIYSYCSIRHITATIEASGAGYSAFAGDGALYIEYANYVHTEDYSEWVITPRDYTLTLDGAGGTRSGQGSVVHDVAFETNIFPEEVDLATYGFARLGYKQIGWQTADGTTLELDAVYEPPFDPYSADETNITLTALWECVGPEIAVSDDVLTAAVPDVWCAENNVSTAVLALYAENGQMIGCETMAWTEGQDILFELVLTGTDAYSCSLFFLDGNNAPIAEQMTETLS